MSHCVRYLLDEGIMLLKDGTNSASKFAPHLISNEEAEQFDLSLLSKVVIHNLESGFVFQLWQSCLQVARSTCFEKSRLLLDRLVDARYHIIFLFSCKYFYYASQILIRILAIFFTCWQT